MTTKRNLTSGFLFLGIGLALLGIGCSLESVPADRRRQAAAAREQYEKESKASDEVSKRQRNEELQRKWADPGSLSIQESDAAIEALHSTAPLARANAAERLGDAKGPRAVPALIAALKTESNSIAFQEIVQALAHIHDPRAIDAFVDALAAPNIPDSERELALNAIVENHSEYRYLPQIQKFYDSLTEQSVRSRTRLILERYGKVPPATR